MRLDSIVGPSYIRLGWLCSSDRHSPWRFRAGILRLDQRLATLRAHRNALYAQALKPSGPSFPEASFQALHCSQIEGTARLQTRGIRIAARSHQGWPTGRVCLSTTSNLQSSGFVALRFANGMAVFPGRHYVHVNYPKRQVH